MFEKSKYIWLIVAVISLSLSVIPNDLFQISVALIFMTFYLVKNLPNTQDLKKVQLIVIYCVVVLLAQIFISDVLEFVKSFLLTIFFFIIFFTSQKATFFDSSKLINAISVSVVLILGLQVVQLVEVIIFNSRTSYFLLDEYSISTAKDAGRFESANFVGVLRPVSFFHEPSYMASVLFICLITLKNLNSVLWIRVVAIFGIIASLSTLNHIFLLLYFVYTVPKNYRIYLSVIIIPISLYWISDILSFFRFAEIFQAGTSGWARVVKPFNEVLKEIIVNWTFFGRAVGNNAVVHDNSFFLIISYTGLMFPVFIYFIYRVSRKIIITNKYIVLGLLNLIFLNGAIFTPESSFLVMILFSSLSCYMNNKDNYIRTLEA